MMKGQVAANNGKKGIKPEQDVFQVAKRRARSAIITITRPNIKA